MVRKLLSGSLVVTLALFILFFSLARASLYILASGGEISNLGKKEISVPFVNSDGDSSIEIYKLPETGMLPDNMMYGFKAIRDYLWLTFSQGVNKPKMILLLADKKAVEYGRLLQKDKNDLAIESGIDAVNKLEYAYSSTTTLKGFDIQKKELLRQIYLAGLSYKEVFASGTEKFSLDPEKINSLINKINDWNKEQEKVRENWDY